MYLDKIGEDILHPQVWAVITSIGILFSQYIFSQWSFAFGFFVLFILDTVTGTYIARRTGKFEGSIFRDKLADKTLAYMTIIIAFSTGTKIVLHDSDINVIKYLNLPFYSLFITVELRSIIIKWYEFKKWAWLGTIIHLLDTNKIKRQIPSEEKTSSPNESHKP